MPLSQVFFRQQIALTNMPLPLKIPVNWVCKDDANVLVSSLSTLSLSWSIAKCMTFFSSNPDLYYVNQNLYPFYPGPRMLSHEPYFLMRVLLSFGFCSIFQQLLLLGNQNRTFRVLDNVTANTPYK